MVGVRQLLKLIIVPVFLSSKIVVDGSRPSCLAEASVDLTDEGRNSSGFVNKSGDIFPPESIWTDDNENLFGCPCYFRFCVPLCCPDGYAENKTGACVTDKYTRQIFEHKRKFRKDHNFGVNVRLPNRTGDFLEEKIYTILRDGSIILRTYLRTAAWGEYCLRRFENSRDFVAIVWKDFGESSPLAMPLAISSFVISTLFALATLIVYSLIPELKNLKGLIFRFNLASYISCMIFIIVLFSVNILLLGNYLWYIYTIGTAIHYFGVACMMWLNVMSFDIWRKFRRIHTSPDINLKKRQKTATFIRYSIYVWCGSALPSLISHVYSKFIMKDTDQYSIWWYLILWPIVVISICNICLFIATALHIKQRQKDIANLVSGLNKHHQENSRWFNLYVKLFLIMGGPLILWAVAFSWGNSHFFTLVCILEALQGISVFYTFIWKDDVKRLVRERFDGILHPILVFFRRGDSVSTTEA